MSCKFDYRPTNSFRGNCKTAQRSSSGSTSPVVTSSFRVRRPREPVGLDFMFGKRKLHQTVIGMELRISHQKRFCTEKPSKPRKAIGPFWHMRGMDGYLAGACFHGMRSKLSSCFLFYFHPTEICCVNRDKIFHLY